MTTNAEIEQHNRELDDLIRTGRSAEAFERFYAEDVTMQENLEAPCVGKEANRQREAAFFASITEVHEVSVHAQGAGDGVTFSESTFDVTLANGARVTMNQVATRRWRNGQIIHERFYHS